MCAKTGNISTNPWRKRQAIEASCRYRYSVKGSRSERSPSQVHRQEPSASGKPTCSRPSPPKPSSRSRTHGCSTSCANHCSSRLPPPTCSKSSAARPSTSKQCLTRLSNRLSASATRTRPSSVDRKAQLIILKRATDFHPSLPNSSQLILLEWMEARFRDAFCSNEELFTFPTFWLIQNT